MGWTRTKSGILISDGKEDTQSDLVPTNNKDEMQTQTGLVVPSDNSQSEPQKPNREMRRYVMREVRRQQRRVFRKKLRGEKIVEEAVNRLVSIRPNMVKE